MTSSLGGFDSFDTFFWWGCFVGVDGLMMFYIVLGRATMGLFDLNGFPGCLALGCFSFLLMFYRWWIWSFFLCVCGRFVSFGVVSTVS